MSDPWDVDPIDPWTLLSAGTIVICEVCDRCGETELRVRANRDFPLAQRAGYIPLVCPCGNTDLALDWKRARELLHTGHREGIVKAYDASMDEDHWDDADALDGVVWQREVFKEPRERQED